jgi:ATP-dependent Clp protease adaptor protein ClpS
VLSDDVITAVAAGALPALVGWLLHHGSVFRRIQREQMVLTATAATCAQRRKHRVVAPEHLLATVLVTPEVARALEGTCDLESVVVELEGLLGALPACERDDGVLPWSPQAGSLVRAAIATAWGDPGSLAGERSFPMTILDRLAAMDTGAVRELLSRNGVYPGALRSRRTQSFATPSSPGPRSSTDPADPYRRPPRLRPLTRVVFWNDARTTMELVVEILTQVFSCSETRALYLMFTVHVTGKSAVWSGPSAEGEELARIAARHARERGFDLRITVEAGGERAGA